MKALIWKECRENLKWAMLPMLLVGAIKALHPVPPSLMDYEFLQFLSFVAAVSGATLGFLQIFFESQGDRRAFLLHRPISRSLIFLGKAIAGVGLYLLALGIPFACAVGWAAIPGHVAAPFCWAMTLPWLADILTGVVYYFAGMLAGQREARWYGSRCLGLAAACLCSFFVWALPEFWQAVLAILIMGGLAAVAAWGSFLAGGAYTPQPRLAKTALAVTFLAGLLFLSVTVKLVVGAFLDSDIKERYTLDRGGRLLMVHSERGKSPSVVDLEGREPQQLEGKGLDHRDILHAIKEMEAPVSGNVWPTFHGYRNPGRFSVPYQNDSSLDGERWFYVPDLGRLLGYDRQSKRLIGSFGPDGFVPADQQPRQRFEGELCNYFTYFFEVGPVAYLHFPDAVYTVDLEQRTIRILFTPGKGQTVLWAIQWKDKKRKLSPAIVGTNKSVHIVDETCSVIFAAPLVHDQENYGLVRVGRLENPERFVIWYEPSWRLGTEAVKILPSYLVECDAAGRETARRTVPHRPLIESPLTQALFGLVTPPAEAAVFVGATQDFVSEAKLNTGLEVRPLAFIFLEITQYFIPGAGLDKTVAKGPLLTYRALILLSAVAAALFCFLLARRNSFSRGRCIGWAMCGFVFGPTGLLLMLALQEWPARIACPNCRKPRVVTRDTCEHCGAAHATPAPDGTEIFEKTAATTPAQCV
jgi:hypothetical protein